LFSGEFGHGRGLEARIGEVVPPATPTGSFRRIAQRRICRAAVAHVARITGVDHPQGAPSEEFGDDALLVVVELGGLLEHRAGGQRRIDCFGRHLRQRVGGGSVGLFERILVRARHRVLMATGAIVVEQRLRGHARGGTLQRNTPLGRLRLPP
jgi:hypothetical protein